MAKDAAAAGAGVAALILVAFAVWYLAQSLLLALEAAPLSPALSYLINGVVGVGAGRVPSYPWHSAVDLGPRSSAPAPASTAGDVAAAARRRCRGADHVGVENPHPYGTIGVAMAAGLVAGASPQLRTLLINAWNPSSVEPYRQAGEGRATCRRARFAGPAISIDATLRASAVSTHSPSSRASTCPTHPWMPLPKPTWPAFLRVDVVFVRAAPTGAGLGWRRRGTSAPSRLADRLAADARPRGSSCGRRSAPGFRSAPPPRTRRGRGRDRRAAWQLLGEAGRQYTAAPIPLTVVSTPAVKSERTTTGASSASARRLGRGVDRRAEASAEGVHAAICACTQASTGRRPRPPSSKNALRGPNELNTMLP